VTNSTDLLTGLPGEDLIREGLADALAGRCTIAACLVAIGSPRLLRAGSLRAPVVLPEDAELRLYRLLRQQGGDAYSRYNALLRQLISFEQALDRRQNAKRNAETEN
jgi:hypothetical protein